MDLGKPLEIVEVDLSPLDTPEPFDAPVEVEEQEGELVEVGND